MDVIWYAFGYFFMLVGIWLLLQHFHDTTIKPFVVSVVNQAISTQGIALQNYHEDSLLPAVTLLAQNRVPCEPPPLSEPEETKPAVKRRPQLAEDQIVAIWDRVKSTY